MYWFNVVYAIAGLFLGSLAIRSCFVDTLSGFIAPALFLQGDSVTTVPPFPRLGPLEQRSLMSSVLRRHYDLLRRIRAQLWIGSPAPTVVSSLASLRLDPCRTWSRSSPIPLAALSWSYAGTLR